MTTSLTPEDQLLRNLLAKNEQGNAQQPLTPHPDEESLVLFSRQALSLTERESIAQHLDLCPACRQTVSHLLRLDAADEQPQVVPHLSSARLTTNRLTALAVAACLLLAVGILTFGPGGGRQLADARFYNEAKQQIEHGQFAQAQETLHSAGKSGVQSDRLLSLNAQAERHMPAAVALAFAGKLTQFGYDVNGTMTKEFEPLPIAQGARQALDVLNTAKSSEVETVLNRGHALLSVGEPRSAMQEFARAIDLDPKNSYAWLGRGLAEFMIDDYPAAEQDFHEALYLDSHSIDAQINLALTLTEQGSREEAIAIWQSLLKQPLSVGDRNLVMRALTPSETK